MHFKIYPVVYAPAIVWWMEEEKEEEEEGVVEAVRRFLTRDRLVLAVSSFLMFMLLNGVMYAM